MTEQKPHQPRSQWFEIRDWEPALNAIDPVEPPRPKVDPKAPLPGQRSLFDEPDEDGDAI